MSEIKIVSANCQGLHDLKKKRKKKDVLHFYREQKCNILCLQDTEKRLQFIYKQSLERNKNKKCFRNIYAPLGAKFRFIFSVEAKPVRSKVSKGFKYK